MDGLKRVKIDIKTKTIQSGEVHLTDEEIKEYNETGRVPKSALERANCSFYIDLNEQNTIYDLKMF